MNPLCPKCLRGNAALFEQPRKVVMQLKMRGSPFLDRGGRCKTWVCPRHPKEHHWPAGAYELKHVK